MPPECWDQRCLTIILNSYLFAPLALPSSHSVLFKFLLSKDLSLPGTLVPTRAWPLHLQEPGCFSPTREVAECSFSPVCYPCGVCHLQAPSLFAFPGPSTVPAWRKGTGGFGSAACKVSAGVVHSYQFWLLNSLLSPQLLRP